jgi:predicted NBD/HSP70 family sugar kinase
VKLKISPPLDPDFVPPVLWHQDYDRLCADDPHSREVTIAICRPGGTTFVHQMTVLPASDEHAAGNLKRVERVVKMLLWQKGGSKIMISEAPELVREIGGHYSSAGDRNFDSRVVGERSYLSRMQVEFCPVDAIPAPKDESTVRGGHLDGCRIGFDLGGSDRKAAAVIDGEVVFTEEIDWVPYFQSDLSYHFDGIMDSLRRAAEHLPRVDAIGGSSAGIIIDGEARHSSLLRGLIDADLATSGRYLFHRVRDEWGVPLVVANDGDVAALAGTMMLGQTGLLGIAMGTSTATGYTDPGGRLTSWLNELAFVPVDYRDDAPVDEWSGDVGCCAQYLSQQAVARLAPIAGIEFDGEMSFPDQLIEVQRLIVGEDSRARKIFESIGVYLGYTIPWFADFYDLRCMLLLGRVMSGRGGEIVIEKAREVLEAEFPGHAALPIVTPDERMKRHGQAVAAASLPDLDSHPSCDP